MIVSFPKREHHTNTTAKGAGCYADIDFNSVSLPPILSNAILSDISE